MSKKVVVMAGGTAMRLVLTGLKNCNYDLTAIISMVSNGGSTGRLRDELRVSPVGNIRQSLIAMSFTDPFVEDVLKYRFQSGEMKGHNFGNICLAALEKVTGSLSEAIEHARVWLGVKGKILPASLEDTDLCAELENGEVLYGETEIDQPQYNTDLHLIKIFLEPRVKANPDVIEEILNADYIIIGPGDFYNIIAYFLVDGISQAITESKAKIIHICNIINRNGMTKGFTLKDYINYIETYLGKNRLDFSVYNSRILYPEMQSLCLKREETFVEDCDISPDECKCKIIKADVLSDKVHFSSQADQVQRSYIRHDIDNLARVIQDIIIHRYD